MKYISLKNDRFLAKISYIGAEILSLYDHQAEQEYMWQRDPAVWEGSAPICFPIVCALKEDHYLYEGQSYKMGKHGIVRRAEYELIDHCDTHCILMVKSTKSSMLSYPFEFELHLKFELTHQGLRVAYIVHNKGMKDMPFSLGYHPAFNVDLEKYPMGDYQISFSEKENLDLYGIDQEGCFFHKMKDYLKSEKLITLTTDIFKGDALIFKNIKSKEVSLIRKNSNWKLTMETGGAPHLGLWAKPAAAYVCIEPWYNVPDDQSGTSCLFEKEGMMRLGSEEVFESYYEIKI
jgi:galactose mutarotase-like enzyme